MNPRARSVSVRLVCLVAVVAALVALPAGGAAATSSANLVPNPSFETSLSGWYGYEAGLTRVSDGADGAWAAAVTANRAVSWAISPSTRQVSSTVVGALYSGSASVKARTGSKTVCLRIREWSGGAVVGSSEQCLVPSSTWRAFPVVSYTALRSGSTLDMYAFGRSGAAGDAFDIDAVSLTTSAAAPGPPPPGPSPLAVALTSPTAAVVAGIVEVAASVTAGTATRVEFLADGALIGSDSTSPYAISWDTKTGSDRSVSLVARAVSSTGTSASPTRSVRIDNTAPQTTLTSAPSGTVTVSSATVAFTSSEEGRFECELNLGGWSTCTTPWSLTSLLNGAQTFRVRAIDAAGNVDSTPAIATWTVALAGPAPEPPSASAYHVSPAGSDSNPGTSERPWRTLAKAVATLGAGQTAYLHAGRYAENTGGSCSSGYNAISWTRSGTSSAPITISGYPGEEQQVIIATKLRIMGNFLELTKLVVDQNTAHSSFDKACTGSVGVHVGGDDSVLEALEVRNNSMSGIYLENADRATIMGNLIHHNGKHVNLDHGIYYASGVGGTIANNIIRGNIAYGIQMYPSPRGQVITQNVLVESGRSGVVLSGAADVIVTNNISAFNTETGIRTYEGCSGCRADQNVVFGNTKGDYYLPQPLTVGATIKSDPRFVDRSKGDYRLRDGSPAIDVARTAYSVSTDYAGTKRHLGSGPDIGAFER